jgi:hypothetical protein
MLVRPEADEKHEVVDKRVRPFARFEVLTAVVMKTETVPCKTIRTYRRFRVACCLHVKGPIRPFQLTAVLNALCVCASLSKFSCRIA